MAIPQSMSARDRAVWLLTKLFDRFEERAQWRHTDLEEVVDAIVDAARAPETEHSRALADDVTEHNRRRREEGL